MRILKIALISLALLVPAGCVKPNATPPALAPGAYNRTDQLLYQSLMAAQATIDSLKKSVDANPQIKPALNQAILDYNVAEVAYQTYHASLLTNPQASPAPVQAAVAKVQTDLTGVK